MSTSVTATELRKNVYRLLDQVLETGAPLEIERHGKRLLLSSLEPPSRLERLIPHPELVVGDPEELVHMDWSEEWRPEP